MALHRLLGYKFSAFSNHNNQGLPDFIKKDAEMLIIPEIQK